MRKIGISMQLPDGKLPGFYAQIVKGLAEKVQLFDRDKELIILNNEAERDAALKLLAHYRVGSEELELVLLPPESEVSGLFEDYGFVSRMENRYLYSVRAAFFMFTNNDAPDAEPEQALLQMDEFLVARYPGETGTVYVTDKDSKELMGKIGAAYSCSVRFLE
jgi:hypothetical protein